MAIIVKQSTVMPVTYGNPQSLKLGLIGYFLRSFSCERQIHSHTRITTNPGTAREFGIIDPVQRSLA